MCARGGGCAHVVVGIVCAGWGMCVREVENVRVRGGECARGVG